MIDPNPMRHRRLSTIVPPIVFGVVLLGFVPFADAQVTSLPNNKCLEGKIKNVGGSLAARTGCFSKEASSGFANPSCHQKARDRFAAVFSKLEMKYATTMPPCLTFGDQGAFETALTDYAASIRIATGMATGKCDAAKIKCVGKYVAAVTTCARKAAGTISMIDTSCTGKAAGNLTNGAMGCLDKAALNADCTNAGSQAGVLQGAADQFIQDALLALASDHRYIDNGDGTVTDSATWLMWEKKTTAVGSGVNYADPHDVDNTYTWNVSGTPYPPDGTAFTDFLFRLNTEPCFAGHCDWRLPSEEGQDSPFTGAKELESILLAPYPCGTSPCIDPIFGPTVAGSYWSATTDATDPNSAWLVNFADGLVGNSDKGFNHYVRAVRAGSAAPTPTPTPTATPTATAAETLTPTPTPTPACTPSSSGTYTDNCDGTVTDSATGLMWEKKTTAAGSGQNLADPHDADNLYTWSVTPPYTVSDGTAFTQFLATLNAPPCFAGHCDWRLPSEEGQNVPAEVTELESILLAPYPCGTRPCLDPIFGPTVANYYWSATTKVSKPTFAWTVNFSNGSVSSASKDHLRYVRAVRTGS